MQGDHRTEYASATDRRGDARPNRRRAVAFLRGSVYALTGLLGLSLLILGTVAIIAEVKGTWHWSIHLESTLSYVGLFVRYLLAMLVPLFGLFVAVRGRWSDA
ncbi:hypothetical protein M0R89_14620 [Halorussus limi]|uniref:Uncharacterized protein n=1 Tax=Halorussus limi TaxID=2938695 RepID=A0A8U0HSB1_9EURY|nr:hypothetical protein [Halorussus limi]UPV73767.1 hypothetical protein M0R89_14620 [Halorussus limi]